MPVFNRMKAVAYATHWAFKRSANYPDYSSDGGLGGGGDCTNFVSQCLHAGGWPMIEGPRRDATAWWTRFDESSNNWASAQWFDRFLTWHAPVKRCQRDELEMGDIVMYQTPDFSNPDHAMMVTKVLCGVDGNEIYLTYHSTDTLNKSLSEIENICHPDTKYFYWKVNDVFSGEPRPTHYPLTTG